MSTTTTRDAVRAWAEELDYVHARLGQHFVRSEPRHRVRANLAELLSPTE